MFLDCPNSFCDFDYYRTEITFVNWVRDRQFAQMHVLVVFRGLSFDFFSFVSLIHDQLSIQKAGATEQEVLLRRRQLATSYSYAGFVGLRYTFGSKFANVVNPRFGSGGGFFISF